MCPSFCITSDLRKVETGVCAWQLISTRRGSRPIWSNGQPTVYLDLLEWRKGELFRASDGGEMHVGQAEMPRLWLSRVNHSLQSRSHPCGPCGSTGRLLSSSLIRAYGHTAARASDCVVIRLYGFRPEQSRDWSLRVAADLDPWRKSKGMVPGTACPLPRSSGKPK